MALGTVFAVSVSATQSAQASSCSCNQSTLYTIDIDTLNDSHPHQLMLKADNAYYQLVDDKESVLQDKLYDIRPYEDGRIIAKRNGLYRYIRFGEVVTGIWNLVCRVTAPLSRFSIALCKKAY